MQSDDILNLIEQFWKENQGIVVALVFIILVWIIQRILVRAAKKSVRKAQLPPEAANGIILALRLIALFFVFTILTSYAGLSSEVLALSGFIGAAIGFASSQTIGNVIAGIYVILARPFRIGEFVTIGDVEGIVREISLNYTRIETPDSTRYLVPNRKVLDEKVRRFLQIIYPQDDDEKVDETVIKKTLEILRQTVTKEKEVYIYPFDVAIHSNNPQQKVMKAFDEVCQEWTEKFGYQPTYYVSELPTFHVRYKFIMTVDDPRQILHLQPEFLRAIMERVEQVTKLEDS